MNRFYPMIAALFVSVLLDASPLMAASALAHLGRGGATIVDRAGEVFVIVELSQPVPWKVHLADDPPRLIVEFNELTWNKPPDVSSTSVAEITTSRHAPGWSQMVAVLREPLQIGSAEMETASDGAATLRLRLIPTTAAIFRETANQNAAELRAKGTSLQNMVVAIDPGHGGFDPGAEAGGLVEANLTFSFASLLKEELLRTGRFDVFLTREEDIFIPLEQRLTRARMVQADIFLSLHADTLKGDGGKTSGVTIYTLAPDASQSASEQLAERHSGSDIIAGIDLSGAGDDVALALLDLARQDTMPRAAALSTSLVAALRAAGLAVNSRPERQAELSVLKSADMPSVLIELGFLSSKADVARLGSEKWRQEAARAIRNALLLWEDEDSLRNEAARK